MLRQAVKQTRLFKRTLQTFCVGQPHFNPTKHIVMSHNYHFLAYEEVIGIGEYPTVPVAQKIRTKKYQLEILSRSIDYLKSQNVVVSHSAQQIMDCQVLQAELKVPLQQHSSGLIKHLSQTIIVSDNRFKPIIEQQHRLQFTSELEAGLSDELWSQMTLYDFMIMYDSVLLYLADRSNNFQSAKIKGQLSHQEQYQLDHSNNVETTGINRLKRNIPQNNTIINRLMSLIHE